MGETILFVLAWILTYALSLIVAIPLAGVLVRFRANYTPKGLQLDGEGGVQPHTGPVVNSYFAMFMRVKRLEGWPGLYKGFMPSFLTSLVISAFIIFLPGGSLSNTGGHNKYSAPVEGVWGRLAYSLFMMVISLPVAVITNRAITTPYKLPWFNGLYSLRVLFTPTERRRPWLIFLTPGLLVSEVARIIYVVLFMHPLRILILPSTLDEEQGNPHQPFSAARFAVYLGLMVISTVIMCPLEVISTRLSLQRNHASQGYTSEAQEEDVEIHDSAEYAAAEEDVIGLRSENDPYVGFINCMKRIVHEEGYGTLFRAWWLVFIPLVALPFV